MDPSLADTRIVIRARARRSSGPRVDRASGIVDVTNLAGQAAVTVRRPVPPMLWLPVAPHANCSGSGEHGDAGRRHREDEKCPIVSVPPAGAVTGSGQR